MRYTDHVTDDQSISTPQADVRVTVTEAGRLYHHLEALVPHPSRHAADDGRHGRFTVSSPAWHARAAGLVLDLHALSRDLEATLRLRASGSRLPRGGSDRNTSLALEAIGSLVEAVSDDLVRETRHRLNRWCQRAAACLDEVEEPRRLPRRPGSTEPRCPWCDFTTLRYQPLAGLVRCVNPACRDEENRRPRASVAVGAYTGDLELAWQDGTTGLMT